MLGQDTHHTKLDEHTRHKAQLSLPLRRVFPRHEECRDSGLGPAFGSLRQLHMCSGKGKVNTQLIKVT